MVPIEEPAAMAMTHTTRNATATYSAAQVQLGGQPHESARYTACLDHRRDDADREQEKEQSRGVLRGDAVDGPFSEGREAPGEHGSHEQRHQADDPANGEVKSAGT